MAAARPDTWMPLYWGDYRKHTADLGAAQHGAYLLLIGHYWTTGRPLADDDSKLWRIAAADSRAHWLKLRAALAPFFEIEGGVWRHRRIERELERAQRFVDKQTQNGRRGGRPPKPEGKPEPNPEPNPEANPDATTSPSPSPIVTPTESVAHTLARPLPIEWLPEEAEVAALRRGRPDLVGAFYEQRLADFRDWCRARAVTSHDFTSTWRAFMRKTHAAQGTGPTTGEGPTESWDARRQREFEAAIARGLS